jgi:hypothetical protein
LAWIIREALQQYLLRQRTRAHEGAE